MQEMTVMGRIVAPYGVLGWIKVLPDTEVLDGLSAYPTWWIGRQPNWQQYRLEKLKIHNDLLVVKLADVNDRDLAFGLKGQQIAIPRAQLPTPENDAYYWADLIGLQVVNQASVHLGQVANLMETGANDVLVVKPAKKGLVIANTQAPQAVRERLIPFISDVITNVDLQAQQIIVDWDESY